MVIWWGHHERGPRNQPPNIIATCLFKRVPRLITYKTALPCLALSGLESWWPRMCGKLPQKGRGREGGRVDSVWEYIYIYISHEPTHEQITHLTRPAAHALLLFPSFVGGGVGVVVFVLFLWCFGVWPTLDTLESDFGCRSFKWKCDSTLTWVAVWFLCVPWACWASAQKEQEMSLKRNVRDTFGADSESMEITPKICGILVEGHRFLETHREQERERERS